MSRSVLYLRASYREARLVGDVVCLIAMVHVSLALGMLYERGAVVQHSVHLLATRRQEQQQEELAPL